VTDSDYWARYYAVTVDRPAWETVRFAIRAFAREDGPGQVARFAVDLGCGAGRDTRELLRAGWRVLAVDREPAAIEALRAAVEDGRRSALETAVADLATAAIPRCDLVNASLSLPFLEPSAYWAAWDRIVAALSIGGRVAAMLFGDRDASRDDPSMTCPSPAAIRERLGGFELEHWVDRDEDTLTALGEPHHFHRIDLVARRTRSVADGPSRGPVGASLGLPPTSPG
jgi:tellurite methyltransferase